MHASQPFSRWERAGPYRMSIVIWFNDLQLEVGLHRNQRETRKREGLWPWNGRYSRAGLQLSC